MITAKDLLDTVAEVGDTSIYDATIKVANFDANKLPEIKNAIIAKLGGQVEVKYDTVNNSFFVDGNADVVAQVRAILKEQGVELVGDPAASSEPGAEMDIPVAASAENAESVDTGGDSAEDPEMEEPEAENGDSPDDDTVLQNNNLNTVFQRIVTKIQRMPAIKRASFYRMLVQDIMQSVESKSGANQAMLAVAKDFLSSKF